MIGGENGNIKITNKGMLVAFIFIANSKLLKIPINKQKK